MSDGVLHFCTVERDLPDQELIASLVSIGTQNAVLIVDVYFADDAECSAVDVESILTSSNMLTMAASERKCCVQQQCVFYRLLNCRCKS